MIKIYFKQDKVDFLSRVLY